MKNNKYKITIFCLVACGVLCFGAVGLQLIYSKQKQASLELELESYLRWMAKHMAIESAREEKYYFLFKRNEDECSKYRMNYNAPSKKMELTTNNDDLFIREFNKSMENCLKQNGTK